MTITQGALPRSPEPEVRDKMLDNNPDRIESGNGTLALNIGGRRVLS